MMGAGEMVRALDRRGFLGAGSSSEDEGGGRARFFLAFTGTGSSSDSEGGAVGCFFGAFGGLGTTLGLFGAPFGLPLFFTTMGSGTTAALSSVSTMGTSSIILY